jgi:NAD(P)H-dependent FMN reductase
MPVALPVIQGTLREDNETEDVAAYTLERLQGHEEVSSTLIDPAEVGLGDLDRRLSRKEQLSDAEQRFLDQVTEADGFALVTPEYNHGYPGALKNIIDHVYEPWNRKAFGLVTVGGSTGGVRCEEQLRGVVTGGLAGTVVPRGINVPHPADTFDAEGPADPETWESRFDRLAEQLVVYAEAMREVRRRLGEGGYA